MRDAVGVAYILPDGMHNIGIPTAPTLPTT
jgi:hypothetical protein